MRIHRPILFWIGTVILVASVFLYQSSIHEYNILHTLFDGLTDDTSLYRRIQEFNAKEGSYFETVREKSTAIGIFSGGIVLGILTILYGLMPNKPK